MNRKSLAIMVLVAIIAYLLLAPQTSRFVGGVVPAAASNLTTPTVSSAEYQGAMGDAMADASSASLIPREVVQTEDFGQFSPDKILSGQNYLDPRSQIGYPETLGGVLRNANRQFRSEPMNPRTPVSIFNLSTIPPDTMRPKFEISQEYQ
jgi:hypothetical protein